MKKIMILIMISFFIAGCSKHHQSIKIQDDQQYQKTYIVDEDRDLEIIDRTIKELFDVWQYVSDDVQYGQEDHHANKSYIAKKLFDSYANYKKNGGNYTLNEWMQLKNMSYIQDDCESTWYTLEDLLIARGVNPQRLYAVYGIVYTDKSLTTPRGGHMWGLYFAPSGDVWSLEQLPIKLKASEVIDSGYDLIARSRADDSLKHWKKFNNYDRKRLKSGEPIFVKPTNEGAIVNGI